MEGLSSKRGGEGGGDNETAGKSWGAHARRAVHYFTTVQADTRCTLLKLTGRASKVVNDRMLLGVTRPLGLKSPRDLCLGIGDRVRDVCPGEGLDERSLWFYVTA